MLEKLLFPPLFGIGAFLALCFTGSAFHPPLTAELVAFNIGLGAWAGLRCASGFRRSTWFTHLLYGIGLWSGIFLIATALGIPDAEVGIVARALVAASASAISMFLVWLCLDERI